MKADRIIVYIPYTYDRFPDWDGQLPEVPEGVEIRRVEEDFGPATKLLPALREFAGTQTEILYCDDDMDYRPNWTSVFQKTRKKRPDDCIAISGVPLGIFTKSDGPREHQPRTVRSWRVTDVEFHLRTLFSGVRSRLTGVPTRLIGRRVYLRSGYADVFEGFGGVLVRPEFFHKDVFEIPEKIRPVDDIWLSGMAAANGYGVWAPARVLEPSPGPAWKRDALHEAEFDGMKRNAANLYAIEYLRKHYGIWP
ncbi:glycosyltransferase family 2 protein [Salinihabitans flavidus]|uniref:glycosyltransferase family 2 protein n=1 Tax=Salinihabitans flavidus TaxID=569882 RepID=UPI001587F3A6|nr:glycosyltransferase family 2 protein [Salinihabitans flavidus]